MDIKSQLIILDLDGTLVDSAPDLAYCIDEMMVRLERPCCGEAQVRCWIGNGLERLVRRALTRNLHENPPDTDFNHAYPLFLELYAKHNAKLSNLYPGVTDGLNRLRKLDYNLACVTNKAERFVNPLLDKLGIRDYFSLIVAGDSLPQKKPDPTPLLYVANHFGVEPASSLMVGDSVNDVLAARAAGFAVICVNYGYNHGQDIHDAHPDAVISSLGVLPEAIYKSIAAPRLFDIAKLK